MITARKAAQEALRWLASDARRSSAGIDASMMRLQAVVIAYLWHPWHGGAGECYHTAVVESFFGTLKTELDHHETYATRAEAHLACSNASNCSTTESAGTPRSPANAPVDYEQQPH